MSSYNLIVFDDGVYHCTRMANIRRNVDGDITAKWGNSWYNAKLLCISNKEACQSVAYSLNCDVPYIRLHKMEDSNGQPLTNNDEGSILLNLSEWQKMDNSNNQKETSSCSIDDSCCFQLPLTNNDENPILPSTSGLEYDYISNVMGNTLGVEQPSTTQDKEDVDFEFDSDDSVKDKMYIPNSSESESSDSESEITNPLLSNVQMHSTEYFDSDSLNDEEPSGNMAINIDDGREVAEVASIKPMKRYYPKKYNVCTFCNKKNKNIDRHLQQVHKNELEVKRFLSLPKKCPERKKIIGDLRKLGNFKFNKIRQENDEIFIARKPLNHEVDVKKYTPCQKCKVFITKASLRRHYRSCEPNRKGHKDRNVLIGSRAILEKIHHIANETLKLRVFPVLNEDPIKELIRHDELLILYGNTMCDKYRDEHHFDMIRSRLRIMARFLSIIKSLDSSIDDFKSVFKPDRFELITQALHQIGEYNASTGYFMKATLPSTVGTAMKYIGKLYISQCIKLKDETTKKEVEDLMVLLRTDLESTVNKTSNESLLWKQRQKKIVLPDTKDVLEFNNYLLQNRDRCYGEIIKNGFSYKSWLELSKFTLLTVLVFNRKRPGELERAHIADYNNLHRIDKDKNPEIYNSLSDEGKRAAHEYVRFSIRGKLARGVPVLLQMEMKKCVDLLLKYRENAEILPQNPYLFALPQSKGACNKNFKYLRAGTLLRKYATESNTSNPSALRATQLRKHIATKSALLNLDKDNVHCLQNFLGHEEKIHNQIYRQPLEHREIVNVSKLLELGGGQSLEHNVDDIGNNESTGQRIGQNANEVADNNYTNVQLASASLLQDNNENVHFPSNLDENELTNLQASEENQSSPPRKRQRLLDIEPGYIRRRTWSTPEKTTASEIFANYIDSNKLPSTAECVKLLENNSTLKQRTPQQVRLWINHEINKKTKTGKVIRRSWEEPERELLKQVFWDYIQPNSVGYPSIQEIEEVINKFTLLQNRTPTNVKSQIQHLRKLQQRASF